MFGQLQACAVPQTFSTALRLKQWLAAVSSAEPHCRAHDDGGLYADCTSRGRQLRCALLVPPTDVDTSACSGGVVALATAGILLVIYEASRCTWTCQASMLSLLHSHGAGPFMTEDCALIASLEGGSLDVQFLSRRAKVGASAPGVGVLAPANAEPLPVPKKTKLYIEFAKRERENAQALYHAFQQCALGTIVSLAIAAACTLTDRASGGNHSCLWPARSHSRPWPALSQSCLWTALSHAAVPVARERMVAVVIELGILAWLCLAVCPAGMLHTSVSLWIKTHVVIASPVTAYRCAAADSTLHAFSRMEYAGMTLAPVQRPAEAATEDSRGIRQGSHWQRRR